MATKKEELLKQYKKERTRIKRLSTYWQHKGYQFNLEDILPPVPKRIREGSIRRLQKITSERIKNKATILQVEVAEETALAVIPQSEEAKVTGIKPRPTAEDKAIAIREDFYKDRPEQKGTDMVPYEAPEVILNTAESFDGTERYALEDWGDMFTAEVQVSDEKPKPDAMLYDYEELHSDLDEIKSKLDNWSIKTEWSDELQHIKAREVTAVKEIIKEAIQEFGAVETARIIFEHKSEITEMVNEIMYRGSGTDFLQGRDAISNDLVRIAGIFRGRSLNLRETQELSDWMESQEFQELADETLG